MEKKGAKIMAISYEGLFNLLTEKGISKTELQHRIGMSSTTVAKLAKNENVSLKIIEDICNVLNCQPGDIMAVNSRKKNLLLDLLCIENQLDKKDGLYGRLQVDMARTINCIGAEGEASRPSSEQVRSLFCQNVLVIESGRQIPMDDVTLVYNHFNCLDYILHVAEKKLDESMIFEVYGRLCINTSLTRKVNQGGLKIGAGMYRKNDAMLYGHELLDSSRIVGEMARILADYNSVAFVELEDVLRLYCRFEKLQPFGHYNWIVGRLIMMKECLKNKIMPCVLDDDYSIADFRDAIFNDDYEDIVRKLHSTQEEFKEVVKQYTQHYNVEL